MLVPAAGLTFVLQLMALIGGGVGAAVLALNSTDTSTANLAGSDSDDLTSLTELDLTDPAPPSTFDSERILPLLNQATGFIILGAAFPLLALLAFPRAFLFPENVFGRAVAMGSWSGLLMGGIELVGALLIGDSLGKGLVRFAGKFLVFFVMGLLTGLIFLIFRSVQRSAAYRFLVTRGAL